MSTNYDSKLQGLKQRRQGGAKERTATLSLDSAYQTIEEAYEKRSANKATRYALGALQEVDPTYTKNSYLQGDRVKNQLEKGLQDEIPIVFEYQGSVPLNVHIRDNSDIDLLILHGHYITVDISGVKNKMGGYADWRGESGIQLLSNLKKRSAEVLRSAFPEVKVSTEAKSIALSGGSLSRKVDVVPSYWHDTAVYQTTGQLKDRGVCILDSSVNSIIKNYPFLHMHQINEKDLISNGGVKKMIRLLKTLKIDSDHAKFITLNSYDIAGLVWNFQSSRLRVHYWNELSLLSVARIELGILVGNKVMAMQMKTPDDTRCVIDSEDKFRALVLLFAEVIALSNDVAQEVLGVQNKLLDEQVFKALDLAIIT